MSYKVAVCLSGLTRTLDFCFESIEQFFPNCDFFVHVYDYNVYHEKWGVSYRKWNPNDINSLRKLNIQSLVVQEKQEAFRTFKDYGWPGDLDWMERLSTDDTFNRENEEYIDEKMIGVGSWSMWHTIIQSFQHDFSEYDVVVKARCDLIFNPDYTIHDVIKTIDEKSSLDYFWVDHYQPAIDFAINDVFWIMAPKTADIIKNFYPFRDMRAGNVWGVHKLLSNILSTYTEIKLYHDPDIFPDTLWKIVRPWFIEQEPNWRNIIHKEFIII